LGAEGLLRALDDAGLVVVTVDEPADAAATGYGPDVVWRDVMRLATRIRDGLPWVASNDDGSIPTSYGVAPGHGVMVDMIARFADVTPTIAGKPQPPLLEETIRRVGGQRPLMVGDRLDTDIAGGGAVGVDTLLVMTGVTGLDELVAAGPDERPTYIAADLAGLLEEHPEVAVVDGRCELGGWRAAIDGDGTLDVQGSGSADDWWRAVAALSWWRHDATGSAPDVSRLSPPR
jgi:ribonucleotide monophosphatase NagD (HAD superfamily)